MSNFYKKLNQVGLLGIIDGRYSINPVAFKILSKSSTSSGILGKVIFLFTQIINDGTYIMLLSSLNFLSSLSLSVLVESK